MSLEDLLENVEVKLEVEGEEEELQSEKEDNFNIVDKESSSSSCLICLTSLLSSTGGGGGGGVGAGAQQWKYLWSSNVLPTSNCGPRLATIFLVRNLLHVPREQVATLLSRTTTGEVDVDPGAWCTLCDNCAPLVERAGILYQECLKLSRKVEVIGEQLRDRVKKSSLKSGNVLPEPDDAIENDDDGGCSDVHAFIRNHVKGSGQCGFKDPLRKRRRPNNTCGSRAYGNRGGGDPINNTLLLLRAEQEMYLEGEEQVTSDDDCNEDPVFVPHDNSEQSEEDYAPINSRKKEKEGRSKARTRKLPNSTRSTPADAVNEVPPESHEGRNEGKKTTRKRKYRKGVTEPRVKLAVIHKCDKCDFTSDVKARVRRHAWSHLRHEHFEVYRDGHEDDGGGSLFRCKLCNELCLCGVGTWMRHLKENHASQIGVELFTCHLCGTGFFEQADLSRHVDKIHQAKPFHCKGCTVVFETEDKLAAHMNRKHPHGISKHICEFCGISFVIKSGLNKHCEKFHSEEMSRGPVPSSSTSPGGLHQSEVKCQLCGIKVTHSRALALHQRSCHPELYTFGCDVCSARFAKASFLKEHKTAKHSDKKKELCQYCGKEFSCRKSLGLHWKRHCRKIPGGGEGFIEAPTTSTASAPPPPLTPSTTTGGGNPFEILISSSFR